METKINLELSKQLSKAVSARAKECFTNAYYGIQRHYPDSQYIEGFAVVERDSIPLEHAWLEVNDEIVDPTFCSRSLPFPKAYRVKKRSTPTLAAAYFPVLRVDIRQVDQLIMKTAQTHFMAFIFDEDIFTDEQRKQYKVARQAATELIHMLKNE